MERLYPLFRTRVIRKLVGALLIALILFLMLFSYFDLRLKPVLGVIAEEETRKLAARAADRAAEEVFAAFSGKLVHCSYDERGQLVLLSCDTAAANRLRTALSEQVMQALKEEEYASFRVPVGNLLQGEIFSGHGPGVEVRVVPVSAAEVELQDDFSTAGINQTLFTLSAKVTVHVGLLMPLKQEDKTFTVTCPLIEMVISGDVPEVYLEGK